MITTRRWSYKCTGLGGGLGQEVDWVRRWLSVSFCSVIRVVLRYFSWWIKGGGGGARGPRSPFFLDFLRNVYPRRFFSTHLLFYTLGRRE